MKLLIYKITGILLLLISILLLFFSNNLFIKFFSTIIIILITLYTIYHLFFYFKYKKTEIKILRIDHKPIQVFDRVKLYLDFNRLPKLLPSQYMKIEYELYEKDILFEKRAENVIAKDGNRAELFTTFNRHGNFLMKNLKIIISDYFNLTVNSKRVYFNYYLNIMPMYKEVINTSYKVKFGGDNAIQTNERINSTDFFDNRKYYPGDDPRRINWNIFAKFNEVYIREIEKIPPKEGKIKLLFTPFSENCYEYEFLTSIFYSTILYLKQKNREVEVYYPSGRQLITNNSDIGSIINSSNRKFYNSNGTLNNADLIITSTKEYENLLNTYRIVNSFVISCIFKNIISKKKIIKSLFVINKHDLLFNEIKNTLENINTNKNSEEYLNYINRLSMENNNRLYIEKIGEGFSNKRF